MADGKTVKGYQLKYVFIIGTILGYLPGLFAASVVKRSATFTNPCNSPGGVGVLPKFNDTIRDLKEKTEGLKHDAAEIKALIGTSLHPTTVNGINSNINYTFIEDFPRSVGIEEILDMKFDKPAQQRLLQHWSYLYNMSVLVYHARTMGDIGASGADDGHTLSQIKNSMDFMELKIYDIACDISIALAIKGVTDIPIIAYTIPHNFEHEFNDNRNDEMVRAYILMRDVETVAGHLSEVYDGHMMTHI